MHGARERRANGNFILCEAPELRGYFVCAGVNSSGIANSGGAGRLIAEWIVGGQAPSGLWEVDIRRFGAFSANRKALAERTGETLGLHYAMRWSRQELQTTRRCEPRRCSSCWRPALVTGSAQAQRDADWITRHVEGDEFAALTDVSALWSVLSLMGPDARELPSRLRPDDLSPAGRASSCTCRSKWRAMSTWPCTRPPPAWPTPGCRGALLDAAALRVHQGTPVQVDLWA